MKTIIFFAAIMLITSCSDKEEQDQFIVDRSISMTVKDVNGNDLLDPEFSGSLNENSIKLFYVIEGIAIEAYDGHLDYPRMFKIDKHTNEFRITVFPNTAKGEEFPITYIQWDEFDTDTIGCKVFRDINREIITEVWFNGEKKWEDSELTERFIEVIK
jgi:hypothetical protein